MQNLLLTLVKYMRTFHIKNKWAFFLILAISIIVYLNSLNNSFHYDDKFYIVDNFYVRDIGNVPGAFLHPSYLAVGFPTGHYRPLLFSSYALNYLLGGLSPAGYRIINLAFHIGSAYMLFLILQAMLNSHRDRPSGLSTQAAASIVGDKPPRYNQPVAAGDVAAQDVAAQDVAAGFSLRSTPVFIALASALIFAVHPFNSEVVNYISTRSSVMSAFFYLLAFYCWVRYRSQKFSYFYLSSLLAFLLGMLTKETVITLPVVLWFYDFYFFRRLKPAATCPLKPAATNTATPGDRPEGLSLHAITFYVARHARRLIAYFPFVFILAGAYFAVRFLYWRSLIPPFKRDLLTQFYTEMPVLAKYVRLLLIPVGLNVDHYVAIYSRPALPAIGSFLFLILVIATGVWLFRSKRIEWRVVSFFIFWFFIVLLPTTIMPLNAILQENRGYLAGIAFATLIGVSLWQGAEVAAGFSLRPKSGVGSQISIVLLSILIVIFSITTVQRNTVWRNGLTLWEDAVSKSSLSPVAHHNLAYYYEGEGKVRLAIQEYQRVVELDSSHAMSYYNLGRLYRGIGLTDEAIRAYKEAVRINPDYYKAYNNLGIIYDDVETQDLAIEEFKKAITINPGYIMARMNLGKMYEKIGRLDLAAIEFEAVTRLARHGSEEEKKVYEAMRHLEWIKEKMGNNKIMNGE